MCSAKSIMKIAAAFITVILFFLTTSCAGSGTGNNLVIEKEDEDTSCVFEISRRDLGEMIDYLTELKEKLDSI